MFKRNRHEFTCPDIIYLRNRQKRYTIAQLAVSALIYTGLWIYGWRSEKNEFAKLKNERTEEN